jgi:hypothetical protein
MLSASAVRKRVERGTLQADKDGDGRVYVYLDTATETRRETVRDTSHDTPYAAALVEQLRDENRFLRAELEHKDAILLSLSEGLRAINPPSDAPESPVTASEGSEWPEERRGGAVRHVTPTGSRVLTRPALLVA